MQSEIDNITTEELIEYVVSEDEREAARAVLERCGDSPAAVQLLRHYYVTLPEAREEMAVEVRPLAQKQGHHLFALKTTHHEYLYVSSEEETLFVGELADGLSDQSILKFFEFDSAEAFAKTLTNRRDEQSGHGPGPASKSLATCVACGVTEGEHHLLGCPVEPCPWCEAQLNHCNCRFEKLGVETIEDEHLLVRFEELLEQEGRIAFKTSQNPSYPTAGSDPAPGKAG